MLLPVVWFLCDVRHSQPELIKPPHIVLGSGVVWWVMDNLSKVVGQGGDGWIILPGPG